MGWVVISNAQKNYIPFWESHTPYSAENFPESLLSEFRSLYFLDKGQFMSIEHFGDLISYCAFFYDVFIRNLDLKM